MYFTISIPQKVIEAGLMQKARFAHIGVNGYSLNKKHS